MHLFTPPPRRTGPGDVTSGTVRCKVQCGHIIEHWSGSCQICQEIVVHDAQGTKLYEHKGLALSLIDGCYGEHGLDLGNELVQEGLVDVDTIPVKDHQEGIDSFPSLLCQLWIQEK